MYNFLVTARDGAWDLLAYEYDTERFGEYSSPAIMERLRTLTGAAIEELLSLPALFATSSNTVTTTTLRCSAFGRTETGKAGWPTIWKESTGPRDRRHRRR